MKRNIITIDEDKCNGCGICANACPEGAIKIINGKARLVGDLYCDGLGACIGTCPVGAITIELRDAVAYDERKVMENIIKQGDAVISAHLRHLEEHGQDNYLKEALKILKEKKIEVNLDKKSEAGMKECGCPGSKAVDLRKKDKVSTGSNVTLQSELGNWPIQLHLLNPRAPYLDNAELLISADCAPFAYANFHRKFLKGKVVIIFCPKLDSGREEYIEKLAQIFKTKNIKSVSLVHMEVPCCFGLVEIVQEALKKSGKNIILKEYTISISGDII